MEEKREKVAVKDLIRVYKTGQTEVIALRGLDCVVKEGEIATIFGPSGCGKTTLLNLIGGLDRPTAGSIIVNGENIVKYNEQQLITYRRDIVGFVFQFFNLVPTLNVIENVELPMRLAGKPASLTRDRSRELIEMVGLTPRATHRPDELSGGEQQRVAIAVALSNDPEILLADEPTGELDTQTGQEVLDIFRRLNKEYGKTEIIVTHDRRISSVADHVLEIEDGTIKG